MPLVVLRTGGSVRLVWHRQDLRVHDHPALTEALRHGPVVGLAILEPEDPEAEALDPGDPAAASGPESPRRRALFGHNLRALRDAYRGRGGVLLVREGDPAAILPDLVRRLAVERVHALARFTPAGVARDLATARALRDHGVGIRWHDGLYVHSPGTVRTAGDDAYSVFAPFFRRWTALGTPDPLPAPDRIPAPDLPPAVSPGEIPDHPADVERPPPGEVAALAALERFVDEGLPAYAERRDRLDGRGTSRLSVWIAAGVLSARTAAARVEAEGAAGAPAGAAAWIRELAWRDFLADLLYHRPDLPDAAFHPRWNALSWPGGDDRFAAWRDGRTGVPAVDAAMRQLRETGWISNRARMLAAQFLAKNLRVDWRRGERLFRAWLLDGDLASNVGNWQWAAGLGIDNAPYFRVMSPAAQARKHDPDGSWLRRWAPAGDDTPPPLVDPAEGRAEYLDEARRVPPAGETRPPPSPRPALELATDARLAMVPGVSAAAATRMLDALAANTHLSVEEASGTGPALGTAIRRRFATDR